MNPLRWMVVFLFLGGILGSLTAPRARSSGLRSLADGWLLDGGDTALVVAGAEQEGPVVRGFQGGRKIGLWAAAAQTSLYGMAALPVAGLTLGVVAPTERWQLGLRWERLGRDLLVEDDLVLAFRFGRTPRLGIRYRWLRWAVAAYPMESHGDPALEFGWSGASALGNWDLTILWHPTDPAPWRGQRGRRPLALVKLLPRGWALAVALDLASDGTPHAGFHGLAHLAGGLGLGIRAEPSTGSLGPMLAWQGGRLQLRTCHAVHPHLGVTHRITLGFGEAKAALW